jgi:DNA-directed RNA polymerase specialized sigma24 family protein
MIPILILGVIVLTLLHVLAQPIDATADGPHVEHPGGPFADLRAVTMALEQRGSLVARVARLHFVHGLDTASIAARMQIDPATVERCLWVVRQQPSRRDTGTN